MSFTLHIQLSNSTKKCTHRPLFNDSCPIRVFVMKTKPTFSGESLGNYRFESGNALLSTGNSSVGLKVIAHLMQVLTDKKSSQAHGHGKAVANWNASYCFKSLSNLRQVALVRANIQ